MPEDDTGPGDADSDAGSAYSDFRADIARLEVIRGGRFQVSPAGKISSHAANLIGAKLAPLRADAQRRAEDLVGEAMSARREVSGQEFADTVYDADAISAAAASVTSEFVAFLGRQVTGMAREELVGRAMPAVRCALLLRELGERARRRRSAINSFRGTLKGAGDPTSILRAAVAVCENGRSWDAGVRMGCGSASPGATTRTPRRKGLTSQVVSLEGSEALPTPSSCASTWRQRFRQPWLCRMKAPAWHG